MFQDFLEFIGEGNCFMGTYFLIVLRFLKQEYICTYCQIYRYIGIQIDRWIHNKEVIYAQASQKTGAKIIIQSNSLTPPPPCLFGRNSSRSRIDESLVFFPFSVQLELSQVKMCYQAALEITTRLEYVFHLLGVQCVKKIMVEWSLCRTFLGAK